jgi:hypothetical protein
MTFLHSLEYADLTAEERQRHLGYKMHKRWLGEEPIPMADDADFAPLDNLPESFDWTELGAVTPVKDQGTEN